MPGNTRRRALLASQLFTAMPPLEAVKALVSIMMSVSWSSKGKPLKLRHYGKGTFPRNRPETHIHLSPSGRSSEIGEDTVGRLTKCMYGTQDVLHTWQLDFDLWRVGSILKR